MSDSIKLPCPNDECEGEVEYELDYEQGQKGGWHSPSWRGYWFVRETRSACSKGCVLTKEQRDELEKDADMEASNYQSDIELYGPEPEEV